VVATGCGVFAARKRINPHRETTAEIFAPFSLD